ncbi:LCP family protein [Actinospongicola halichondriae]|uniref:LCP family protein n=1 Tax=Actinospongicola halichondriae TaxID=3236844 RepID=UPI003D4BA800
MSPPKHLARAQRRSAREILLLVLGSALCLLLLTGAGVAGYLNYRFGQITRYDVAIDVAPASGEPRNYLLVGSDSRAGLDADDPANGAFFNDESITVGGPQRTDTIMILRVDPDDGAASLLSFPRDLWVPIAGTGKSNRINTAFTAGREVLIDTIRENFGIPIHHYVEIDFVGFMGLVESIGGVPFYFDAPVRDTHSGLVVQDSGCITLDSRQSLSFARSRYLEHYDYETGRWKTDPTGDLGRISRQQEFIRRAISTAVSKGLSNPATLNDLVNIGVDFVGLDPSLGVTDILSLGRRFASFDADTLQTYSLPATPFRTSAGAAVLDLDTKGAEPILNIFRGLDPSELTPGLIDTTVLNGTGVDGLAGDVTAALDALGFATTEPGDTTEVFAESAVYYASGSENAASRLVRHLTSPVHLAVDEDLEPGEVVLVVGQDFTTVHDQPSPTLPELPSTTTTTTSTTAPSDASTSSTVVTTPESTTSTTAPIGYLPDRDAAAACT